MDDREMEEEFEEPLIDDIENVFVADLEDESEDDDKNSKSTKRTSKKKRLNIEFEEEKERTVKNK